MTNPIDANVSQALIQAIDAVARARSGASDMFARLELFSQDLKDAEASLERHYRAMKHGIKSGQAAPAGADGLTATMDGYDGMGRTASESGPPEA